MHVDDTERFRTLADESIARCDGIGGLILYEWYLNGDGSESTWPHTRSPRWVPRWAHSTAEFLTILNKRGNSLANLPRGSLWRGSYLALFHILMTVAYALVELFSLSGMLRKVFILGCLMPVAVSTYLWVEIYRPQNTEDVASMVFVSTLLSILVLPLALAYWV